MDNIQARIFHIQDDLIATQRKISIPYAFWKSILNIVDELELQKKELLNSIAQVRAKKENTYYFLHGAYFVEEESSFIISHHRASMLTIWPTTCGQLSKLKPSSP